jgi:hypothetical protein
MQTVTFRSAVAAIFPAPALAPAIAAIATAIPIQAANLIASTSAGTGGSEE